MEPNSNYMPSQMPEQPVQAQNNQPEQGPKHPNLPILLSVLALAVLLAVGFYLWQNYIPGEEVNESALVTETEGASLESIEAQGDSTEPSDIESELDAQSSDDYDAEIDRAFVELDSSFGY